MNALAPHVRHTLASAILVTLAATIMACGGRQNGGGDGCPSLRESMSGNAVAGAISCYAQMPVTDGAALCRATLGRAASLPPDALQEAVSCTLAAGERSDGAEVAAALMLVQDEAAKVRAIANGFDPHFDRGLHGNSFAASLTTEAQIALGRVLDDLTTGAQRAIVGTALSYRMAGLLPFCGEHVGLLDADDPAVASYARLIDVDSGEPLNETQRWALATAGRWTAANVVACYQREQSGCEDWDGGSPLLLLANPNVPSADSRDASDVVAIMRNDSHDPDTIRALTTWISSADYPNRAGIINSIMLDMTDPGKELADRMAIANAASAAMCDYGRVRDLYQRSRARGFDGTRTATGVWPTYIRTCFEQHWAPADMAMALAAGSRLNVTPSFRAEIRARLAEETADGSCADFEGLADIAYNSRTTNVPMTGRGVVEVARISGACADRFDARIRRIAADDSEHPEGRLAAVEWMLEQGDDSGCSHIGDAMRWHVAEREEGPGREAEELAGELRGRCR